MKFHVTVKYADETLEFDTDKINWWGGASGGRTDGFGCKIDGQESICVPFSQVRWFSIKEQP